jgi:hypothetical protein
LATFPEGDRSKKPDSIIPQDVENQIFDGDWEIYRESSLSHRDNIMREERGEYEKW